MATALELLQHYLTSGIPMQVNTEDGLREGVLYSLCPTEKESVGIEMRTKDGDKPFVGFWAPDECLPVLRPFSQLPTPLADGSIPAVEVAKLILDLTPDHCEDGYIDGIVASMQQDDWLGDCIVTDAADTMLLSIYSDWLLSAPDVLVPVEAYDYLRSKLFALPVNGRPLIEGEDYIAKDPTPPATPTTDKEGSQS